MQRQIILTRDGSHSVFIPESGVSYHSVYGAIQESMHVFIDSGLKPLSLTKDEVRVFEMGFGTGLNALLTFLFAEKEKKKIYYQSIEAYPLESSLVEKINYCRELDKEDLQTVFEKLHSAEWGKDIEIASNFILHKIQADFNNYSPDEQFDIIYYDAFDPKSQPELWTLAVFKNLWTMISPGGSLLTYCSKGIVRRAMQEAGFSVEKLKGPEGKREIIKANKY